MSKQVSDKKALKLLQKIVQDDENNSELLDNVIKENSYKLSKNMKKEQQKNGERKSRPRTKNRDVESKIDTQERSRSYSDSRSSRSSSVSVSSRSRSRSRSRSVSRSRSRSRSRSDSRSRSTSPSQSRSTSRTPDGTSTSEPKHRSRSRSSSRSRSRSPQANRITVKYTPIVKDKKEETKETLSTSDSVVKQEKGYSEMFVSGQGHLSQPQKDKEKPEIRPRQRTKKRKLLNRSPIRKFRSMEINPDVFIEEKLKQKYEELNQLMSQNRVSDPKIHVTRQHYHQMQVLRDQYVNVSHGLPPSGVLIPRSLPGKTRPHSATLPLRKTRRPWSGNSYSTTNTYNGSEFGEDIAYHTIHNVVHATAARNHGKIQAENEIPNKAKSRKKKLRKRKDSESTQDSRIEKHNEEISDTCSKTTDGDGSLSTLTPRDNIHIPADYHLKNCNNEKLLHWLKEKNKEYRRQKRAEKEKKKEERQKKILEANEKFERMLESEKKVKQWMSKKKKEENHKKKVERETSRNRLDITLPGKSLGIRPISPGPRVMRKNFENESVEFEKEKSEETKIDSPEPVEQMTVGPHPPNSKFIYKRPVAGSIKLKIRNRPQSSPTTQVSKETKDSANKAKEAERMQKMRMSYDDWLKKKHQDDIERKKFEKKQKEIMSKSDPELNKIIPDIAKKRIHNVLEGKKRIDTGVHIFDNEKNKEFGGADFPNENIDESEDGERKTRCSYRLEEDRVKDSSDTSESKLKVDGTGIQKPGRPQTAPARVSRVPAPKLSSSSPRKAVVPAKVDDIMSNEDKTNPFRLPFSAEEGVPKHVASRQRKLFAEKTWQKLEDEERPEPQGCDSTEPSLCTTGSTQKTADSQATGIKDNKNESSSKTEQNSANNDVSIKTKEAKEIINIESRNVEDESIVSNSSAFLTQEIVETKSFLENDKEETSQTKDDKISSVDETDGNNIQDRDTDKKDQENENIENSDKSTNEDNSSVRNEENKDFQTSDNSEDDSNAKGDNSLDEGEKNNDKKNDETEVENQGKTEDVKLLGLDNLAEKDISTSRSSKHVSFRDETEVFGEGDQIIPPDLEWSTDTETPDDDNYQGLGENQETNKGEEGEINSSIDSYGNELDNNSARVNQMQTSTDDEF